MIDSQLPQVRNRFKSAIVVLYCFVAAALVALPSFGRMTMSSSAVKVEDGSRSHDIPIIDPNPEEPLPKVAWLMTFPNSVSCCHNCQLLNPCVRQNDPAAHEITCVHCRNKGNNIHIKTDSTIYKYNNSYQLWEWTRETWDKHTHSIQFGSRPVSSASWREHAIQIYSDQNTLWRYMSWLFQSLRLCRNRTLLWNRM